MNKKVLLSLLIVIFALLTIPVYALPTNPGGVITGKIKFNGEIYPDAHSVGLPSYHSYIINITFDGESTPRRAYCLFPDLHASSGNTVTCEPADPTQFPLASSLAAYIQGKSYSENELDLAFRVAGVSDLFQKGYYSPEYINGRASLALFYTSLIYWRAAFINPACGSAPFGGHDGYMGYVSFTQGMQDACRLVVDSIDTPPLTSNITTPSADGSTGGIFTITETNRTDKTKTFSVTSKVSMPVPQLTTTGGLLAKWDIWNGTAGQLTISAKSPTECKGTVSLGSASASVTTTTTDATQMYFCRINGDRNQSYITFGPGTNADSFEVDICNDECNPTNVTVPGAPVCTPVPGFSELKEQDVHNCCEEQGGYAQGRQYALNELFCVRTKNGVSVQYAKEKCNTDEYLYDGDNNNIDGAPYNKYCKQYCSNSFHYDIPGPTHMKADAYFYFSTRTYNGKELGVSGPVLDQWRRCRTIIDFDKWYQEYKTLADSLPASHNAYQENQAYYEMWNDMIGDEGTNQITSKGTKVECSAKYHKDNYGWKPAKYCDTTKNADGTCPSGHEKDCTDGVSDCSWEVTSTTPGETGKYSKTSDDQVIRFYPTNSYAPLDKYKYAVISRKSDDNTDYTYSKMWYDKNEKPKGSGKYWNKDDWDDYMDSYKTARKGAQDDAKNAIPADNTFDELVCSNDNLESPPGTDTCTIDPTKELNKYKKAATTGRQGVNTTQSSIDDLEKTLNQCGGEIAISGGRNGEIIKKRVEFEKEPEMEFAYSSAFIDDYGMENDQILSIPFKKVGDSCIQNVTSGFEKLGGYYDEEWKEGSEIFADIYDSAKYGSGQTDLYDFDKKGYTSNQLFATSTPGGQYLVNSKQYKADKKFTTDSSAHMTCKWKEDGAVPEYTIYPSGIIIENDSGKLCEIRNCSEHHAECPDGGTLEPSGSYHTIKTHISGMYETYFSLSQICDGIFDDVVNEKGISCSGNRGMKINVDGKEVKVNATCYFEVNEYFARIKDCNEKNYHVFNAAEFEKTGNKAVTTLCCSDPKDCSGKNNYEYKVIDPEIVIADEDKGYFGKNYGWNWLDDEDGKKEKERIKNLAETDSTYAPEQLSYSFTLTPRDLRAIREYNKTKTSEGGYMDFDMYCDDRGNENGKPLTKCKSRFLDAISGGSLTSGTYTLSITTNNIDLNISRNYRTISGPNGWE